MAERCSETALFECCLEKPRALGSFKLHKSRCNIQNEQMKNRLAVFISFSGQGGVERMMRNLLNELSHYNLDIDLLTVRAESKDVKSIDKRVRWIPLEAAHSLTSIPELARYLKRYRPAVLLVAKDRAGRAAIIAKLISGAKASIVVRFGTHLLASLQYKSAWHRWIRTLPMPILYKNADKVIAVSKGVASDTHRITGMPLARITVIQNPVITKDIFRFADEPNPHPWLARDRTCPVVMGAGRLTRQKDFPTLLRAFASIHEQRQIRLIILGDGRGRDLLQAISGELGIESDLLLPGAQANPYKWMARTDLFVLSSLWEGSPNVLTEAMALGKPVVSTDCPSGPREILEQGHIAPLVPVGDWQALAGAMRQVLDNPPQPERLRAAVRGYDAGLSASRYLEALGLTGCSPSAGC